MNKIFFITGVCGSGKSTTIPLLKTFLPKEEYEVFDFDSRGVPKNADRTWRISETKFWISEGARLAKENKNTIICGFIRAGDLQEHNLINSESPEIELILLDAKPEIIKQRLVKRYTKNGFFDPFQKVIGKPVNEFIESNVCFVEQMREEFKKSNFLIIDTSELIPEEVAKKIKYLIDKN